MTHVIGEKGQVVLDKSIRDRLGVKKGWTTIQRLAGDHVEIYFVPPAHDTSLRGSLAAHVGARDAADMEWEDIRRLAWEKAAEAQDKEV